MLSTFSDLLLAEGLPEYDALSTDCPATFEVSVPKFYLGVFSLNHTKGLLNHSDSFRGWMSKSQIKLDSYSLCMQQSQNAQAHLLESHCKLSNPTKKFLFCMLSNIFSMFSNDSKPYLENISAIPWLQIPMKVSIAREFSSRKKISQRIIK